MHAGLEMSCSYVTVLTVVSMLQQGGVLFTSKLCASKFNFQLENIPLERVYFKCYLVLIMAFPLSFLSSKHHRTEGGKNI